MSCEPRIHVDRLSKCYYVFDTPPDRLKQSIVPRLQQAAAPFAHMLGKTITPRRYYREFWALRDVSFTVGVGETIGVIGRNGAGKSTLLQLVCGTLAPTSGSAAIKGRVAALLELGSGFNPEFTGRENVYLNASVLGLSGAEIDAKLASILEFADIGNFVDQPIKTYSSGMAMRLAFAVIAHVDADVLIVDEALAVGDASFQQKCMRWLRRFCEQGTVLFCGHDTGAVMNLCSRAIWLDGGAVRASGNAKEVCEAYMGFVHAEASGLPEHAIQHRMRPKQVTPKPTSAESTEEAPQPDNLEPNAAISTSGTSNAVPPDSPPARQRGGALKNEGAAVLNFESGAAGFGTGEAIIEDANILAADGEPLAWIEGSESVMVVVRIRVNRDMENPIVGFFFKDRFGQAVLGDNTFLSYADTPLGVQAGQNLEAHFSFDLPNLMSGDYTADVAIASGTLTHYVVHQWLHDAFAIRVHSPYRNGVLIAVPMHSVVLKVVDPPVSALVSTG